MENNTLNNLTSAYTYEHRHFSGEGFGCIESSLIALGGDKNIIDELARKRKAGILGTDANTTDFIKKTGFDIVSKVTNPKSENEIKECFNSPDIQGLLIIIVKEGLKGHAFSVISPDKFPKNSLKRKMQENGQYVVYNTEDPSPISYHKTLEVLLSELKKTLYSNIFVLKKQNK